MENEDTRGAMEQDEDVIEVQIQTDANEDVPEDPLRDLPGLPRQGSQAQEEQGGQRPPFPPRGRGEGRANRGAVGRDGLEDLIAEQILDEDDEDEDMNEGRTPNGDDRPDYFGDDFRMIEDHHRRGRRRRRRERDQGRGDREDRGGGGRDNDNSDRGDPERGGGTMPRHVQRALWRILVGDPARLGPEPSSHEELMESLKRARVLIDNSVINAMNLIPRGDFVPQEQQSEAYLDCPLSVPQLGFNISAPHIHATCLEKLKLEPGHHFLDVGSGCGIVTCLGAYIVGKTGSAVGIEINDDAIRVARANLNNLKEKVPEYAMNACDAKFEKQNVFLPDPCGRLYDRINVAGTCPRARIGSLLSLLKEDGKLIVPCGSELQLFTKFNHMLHMSVISHVRFGELVVPSDAEIVVKTLEIDKRKHIEQSRGDLKASSSEDAAAGALVEEELKITSNSLDYDCLLVGRRIPNGIPAHKKLLASKCLLFQAQFNSGMRDALSNEFVIPDHFSFQVCQLLVDYLYCRGVFEEKIQSSSGTTSSPEEDDDAIREEEPAGERREEEGKRAENSEKEAQEGETSCRESEKENHPLKDVPIRSVVELFELGTYVNCADLCRFCEGRLVKLISSDNCVDLLMVADAAGCAPCLHHECLDFIISHYQEVRKKSDDFEGMDRHLVLAIAEMASSKFQKVMAILKKNDFPINNKQP